jgi:hypothetical protein
LAAWIGLVPRQDSTGGKQKLGPISKQGDQYLRRILVVGAHAVLRRARQQPEKYPWLTQLLASKPFKVVCLISRITALQMRDADRRPPRRVQPLLIVIGTDTAHMPARSHPGYDAASQNCKEENASRFRRMSVIGKSGRDADLGKTTLLTQNRRARYGTAFALSRAVKVGHGLREGLTEAERCAVADHVVAQPRERGDPW